VTSAVWGAYPARIAACLPFKSTKYSSMKRCCRTLSLVLDLTTDFGVFGPLKVTMGSGPGSAADRVARAEAPCRRQSEATPGEPPQADPRAGPGRLLQRRLLHYYSHPLGTVQGVVRPVCKRAEFLGCWCPAVSGSTHFHGFESRRGRCTHRLERGEMRDLFGGLGITVTAL
jgi:hypothetical protein